VWTWSGFPAGVRRRVGPLTVVRDRNQIHSKSEAVRSWLAEHPEVVASDFPGYVPDLNPDEGVWGWAEYGRLASPTPHDKRELHDRAVEIDHRQTSPRPVARVHPTDRLAGSLTSREVPHFWWTRG
jgi:hypothetical protein